jgi:hypothetical protein
VDGLRLVACVEGFEAQYWTASQLEASRWWPAALTDGDWSDFIRASGASRAEPGLLQTRPPQPVAADWTPRPWTKHYALDVTEDGDRGIEQRLVLAGGLALSLVTGALGHQLWDVRRESQDLQQQMLEVKSAAAEVLSARDATMAQVQEVEKLAAWYAVPQPIDVIAHLHETLGRSGALIKELDLDGSKLRLGLQLSPQASRAGLVKDLQSGGWLVDVTEVRADNARNLLTMEMRVNGPRPPVAGTAPAAPELVPPSVVPAPAAAPTRVGPPALSPAPAVAPRQPTAAAAARPASAPTGPIFAKPDANGLPPASVFDAIPAR